MSRPPVLHERHGAWPVALFKPAATSVPNGYCYEEDRRERVASDKGAAVLRHVGAGGLERHRLAWHTVDVGESWYTSMVKELRQISVDELAANLSDVLKRVIVDHETVVVETTEGARALVSPYPSKRRKRRTISDAHYEAFLASAGGWKDVDTEKLKRDIAESRRLSTRPPIEL
jgi:hypothetical protein